MSATEGSVATVCGDKHYFPREPIARTAAKHAVCSKPFGHTDGHEATYGSTAYTWANEGEAVDDPADGDDQGN